MRNLLLPDGLPRRIVFSDHFDPSTGIHTNPRTVYLDDTEPLPATAEEALEFLKADVEGTTLKATLDATPGDALAQCKAFLSAVDADRKTAAVAWKGKRTVAVAKVTVSKEAL